MEAPGFSSIRVRGITVLNTIRFVRERYGADAHDRVVATLPAERCGTFTGPLRDASWKSLEDVVAMYERAREEGLKVARIHSGDPALWGGTQEQLDRCARIGIATEVVPGVSAFSAVAALAQRELTIPEVAQSVVLTRLGGGKTPMPPGEEVREFAKHGTTMAIFLSAARSGQLVRELLEGGYPTSTPVVVAYQATWPEELVPLP